MLKDQNTNPDYEAAIQTANDAPAPQASVKEHAMQKVRDEIVKIIKRIPLWLLKPWQINSNILYCFMRLREQHNNGPVPLADLEVAVILRADKHDLKPVNKKNFKSNFIQMASSAPHNHAHVFEKGPDNFVKLWKEAEDVILKIWNEHPKKILDF